MFDEPESTRHLARVATAKAGIKTPLASLQRVDNVNLARSISPTTNINNNTSPG